MRNINLRFVEETYAEDGQLETFKVNCPEDFNFGYDVVDDIAEKFPFQGMKPRWSYHEDGSPIDR